MTNFRYNQERFEMFLNLKTMITLLLKLKLLICSTEPQLIAGADHFRFVFNSSSFNIITSMRVAIPSRSLDVSSVSDGDVKREMQRLRS
jgi:hypothetical protein